jgi:hypothetical protein
VIEHHFLDGIEHQLAVVVRTRDESVREKLSVVQSFVTALYSGIRDRMAVVVVPN